MAIHPLCNKFSLQSGTMAVATLNFVGSLAILLVGFVLLFLGMQVETDTSQEIDSSEAKTFLIIVAIVLMFMGIFSVLFSYMLYSGAKTRNTMKCQVWLIIAIMGIIGSVFQIPGDPSSFAAKLIGLIFEGYCLWIVWAFIQETKVEKESGSEVVTAECEP